ALRSGKKTIARPLAESSQKGIDHANPTTRTATATASALAVRSPSRSSHVSPGGIRVPIRGSRLIGSASAKVIASQPVPIAVGKLHVLITVRKPATGGIAP